MDGRGRALDNVFIERLWWSVKYEEVYPSDYADGHVAHQRLEKYFGFYNNERRHQVLDQRIPREVYLSCPTAAQERRTPEEAHPTLQFAS